MINAAHKSEAHLEKAKEQVRFLLETTSISFAIFTEGDEFWEEDNPLHFKGFMTSARQNYQWQYENFMDKIQNNEKLL